MRSPLISTFLLGVLTLPCLAQTAAVQSAVVKPDNGGTAAICAGLSTETNAIRPCAPILKRSPDEPP